MTRNSVEKYQKYISDYKNNINNITEKPPRCSITRSEDFKSLKSLYNEMMLKVKILDNRVDRLLKMHSLCPERQLDIKSKISISMEESVINHCLIYQSAMEVADILADEWNFIVDPE